MTAPLCKSFKLDLFRGWCNFKLALMDQELTYSEKGSK